MKHFLIHIISTVIIIVFSQLFFGSFGFYTYAQDVDPAKLCIDLPILSTGTVLVKDNKEPVEKYKIYFSLDPNSGVDISKTYAGFSWVGTGVCPGCAYGSMLTDTLVPITDRGEINEFGNNIDRELSRYNYVAYMKQNINLDETVGFNFYYYEFILKSADGVNLLTTTGSKCIGSFEVAKEPPDLEAVNCISSNVPQNSSQSGYYSCTWDGGMGNWNLQSNCIDSYEADSDCNTQNKDRYYFDRKYSLTDTSFRGFCSVCNQKKSDPAVLKSYNTECDLPSDDKNDNCEEGLICTKSITNGKNICMRISATQGEACIIGENECVTAYNGSPLLCIDTNRIYKASYGMVGSLGECRPESDIEFISCVDNKKCEQELNKITRTDARESFTMKDLGYVDAICDPTYKRCVFATSAEEANRIQYEKAQQLDLSGAPVIPAPPSRFIEKCNSIEECANCVARKSDGNKFESFPEAAAMEYDYNVAVDRWVKDMQDGIFSAQPTPSEFEYTGYIYTSLGCIDTTDSGLITRVVQIALGTIGAIILVRFAQAAMKLQGGSSPEDRAEGVEIVSSAIVALLLFVMSFIILKFIGIDLLKVFSPNTVEFTEEKP